MKHFAAAGALLVATLFSAEAGAVASKTFVSQSGSDSNTASNCSKNAPCRTFVAAYGVTSSGGQIVVIDTGVYGQLTITTPVTIAAADGVTAIVQVPQNQTGFTVSAGASDLVVLRNITLYGTNTGTTGVNHTSGRLILDHMTFSGLTIGLDSVAKTDIVDSDFYGNGTGLRVTGSGCANAFPMVCDTAVAKINRGNFLGNGTALVSVNPGTDKVNILQQAPGGQYNSNYSANTTFMSSTGTGGVASNPQPQQYYNNFNPL
jgi:hypothetical protein